MVFSSILFLFLFLPIVLLIFYFTWLLARKYTNSILLLFSLIFYAWGERKYTIILIFITLFSFIFGKLIYTSKKLRKGERCILLAVFLFVNVFVLVLFKVQSALPFDIHLILSTKFFTFALLHLPLGISFFIFHAISYVIDIYRDNAIPQNNIINFALYISFFPQLIAGPIIRYKLFYQQLTHRSLNVEKTFAGIQRFVIGLTKKVLLSNTIGLTVDQIFALSKHNINFLTAWIGIICYALQIYFDFSGYTDMAIGLASIFGFTFPENFNYPYISMSIREFWQRWHITLTAFLRDYLYIPLGGNRLGKVRTYINIFVVFLICGLWHGINFTFAVWGILHGLFLIIERTQFGKILSRLPKSVQHIYTILIVLVGWVFFRSNDITQAINYIRTMFIIPNLHLSLNPTTPLSNELIILIPIATVTSLNILPSFLHKIKSKFHRLLPGLPDIFKYAQIIFLLTFLILDSAVLAGETHNPFIYFRF